MHNRQQDCPVEEHEHGVCITALEGDKPLPTLVAEPTQTVCHEEWCHDGKAQSQYLQHLVCDTQYITDKTRRPQQGQIETVLPSVCLKLYVFWCSHSLTINAFSLQNYAFSCTYRVLSLKK